MSVATAAGNTALITGTRALVSGATGFLGGHLAQVLHRSGYRVRILVHRRHRVEHLLALGLEIVEGDLLDTASLVRAAAGQSVVFHTAGKVTDWGPREEYFQVNAEGTRNVIAACRQTGVERLVHVSSLSVLGLPRTGEVINEETPCAAAPPDWYSQSKKAAEQLVRAANGEGGLATTVVRPGVIWGPGDITIVPRLADLLRRGHMVLIDGGRNLLGLSHIESLARGLVLAAESPRAPGQIYHMTDGEEITGREAVDALADAMGVQRARRSLPYPAVYGIAAVIEAVARLARRQSPPRLTRYGVRLVACHCRYDIGKARRELGYRPVVTFREGLRELEFRPAEVVLKGKAG